MAKNKSCGIDAPRSAIAAGSILSLMIVACVGCVDISDSRETADEATRPASERSPPTKPRADSDNYLRCQAKLVALEPEHPWFDDSSVGHDHGVAVLAIFAVSEPATYSEYSVKILFKYAAKQNAMEPPEQSDIGSQFSFEIPKQYFDGNFKTIDNSMIRMLRKLEP